MLGFSSIAGAPIAAPEPPAFVKWGLGAATGSFHITGSQGQLAPVSGFLTRKNFLAFQDFLGAAAATRMISWAEVNIGLPDGFGGLIWQGWQKFSPGNYQGQAANLRFAIQAPTPDIVGELLDAAAQCSVPNRIDKYLNVAIAAGGTTIAFTPANSTTPKPFNKGPITAAHPNGEPLPGWWVIYNNQPGDQLIASALSLSAITLQVLNGGVGVARTFSSIYVEGF